MEDRQMQRMVSRIVATAELVPEKYYHLCWWQEQVRCHHVRHAKHAHEVFFSALGHVFLDGLSVYQWRLVTTRIADFCRRQGIILDRDTGRREEVHPMPRRRITEFDAVRLQGLLVERKDAGIRPLHSCG